MPRFHVPDLLAAGTVLSLPPAVVRHVQVLRAQPGDSLHLFNARDGEWRATVLRMQRQAVEVRLVEQVCVARAPESHIALAVGMPANDRMDTLVEKATELGAAELVPLLCERSVVRLRGERAERKVAHWQAVATAACEQSGRLAPPKIAPVSRLDDWLPAQAAPEALRPRWLLSLAPGAQAFHQACRGRDGIFLSGPEGGLTEREQALAQQHGFRPVSLGRLILRADTAPLAALAALQLNATP